MEDIHEMFLHPMGEVQLPASRVVLGLLSVGPVSLIGKLHTSFLS